MNQQISKPAFKTLSNKKGLSMIEVLLAMSMLALLGYFMADMIVSQQTSISSSESRLEGVEVFRQIHDLVASDDSCAKSFAGDSSASPAIPALTLDINPSGGLTTTSFNVLRDKNGNPVFETTKTYGNGKIKITGFKIKNKTIPSAGGSGDAILSLFYERLIGNLKGKELTKDLLLKLSTEPDGSIVNCHLDKEGPPWLYCGLRCY